MCWNFSLVTVLSLCFQSNENKIWNAVRYLTCQICHISQWRNLSGYINLLLSFAFKIYNPTLTLLPFGHMAKYIQSYLHVIFPTSTWNSNTNSIWFLWLGSCPPIICAKTSCCFWFFLRHAKFTVSPDIKTQFLAKYNSYLSCSPAEACTVPAPRVVCSSTYR